MAASDAFFPFADGPGILIAAGVKAIVQPGGSVRDADTIEAAQAAGVTHYVMVSYMGAGQDHGVPEDNDFYSYAQSKADADDHLRASSLEWTILGPGTLTDDDPSGEITLGRAGSDDEKKTARGNVALVAARVLADPRGTAGKFIEFSDGDTPIAEALENLG